MKNHYLYTILLLLFAISLLIFGLLFHFSTRPAEQTNNIFASISIVSIVISLPTLLYIFICDTSTYIQLAEDSIFIKKHQFQLDTFLEPIYYKDITQIDIKKDRICIYTDHKIKPIHFAYLEEADKNSLISFCEVSLAKKVKLTHSNYLDKLQQDNTTTQDKFIYQTNIVEKFYGLFIIYLAIIYTAFTIILMHGRGLRAFAKLNSVLLITLTGLVAISHLYRGLTDFIQPKYCVIVSSNTLVIQKKIFKKIKINIADILEIKLHDFGIEIYTKQDFYRIEYQLFVNDDVSTFLAILKHKMAKTTND